jgi:hypothetical protein
VIVIGGRAFVDEAKAPRGTENRPADLLSVYRGLLEFGYANDLMDGYTSRAEDLKPSAATVAHAPEPYGLSVQRADGRRYRDR